MFMELGPGFLCLKAAISAANTPDRPLLLGAALAINVALRGSAEKNELKSEESNHGNTESSAEPTWQR